jgi:hypothetical protein
MQGIESRPDDEIQEEKDEELVEAADEACGRQAPQQQ